MLDETFSVSFKHCGYLENGEETKIAPVSNKDCCWIETVMHFRIKLQSKGCRLTLGGFTPWTGLLFCEGLALAGLGKVASG